MEENRIFDLVLVKYGYILVIYGHFLVKCGRSLEIFGIDVLYLLSDTGRICTCRSADDDNTVAGAPRLERQQQHRQHSYTIAVAVAEAAAAAATAAVQHQYRRRRCSGSGRGSSESTPTSPGRFGWAFELGRGRVGPDLDRVGPDSD
jgi:hypothetical protein